MPLPDVFLDRPNADVEINQALALVVFLEDDGKIYFGTLSAYDNTNTRLGIGTTAPARILHLFSSAALRALVECSGAANADLELKNSARSWIFRCSAAGNFAFLDGNTAAFPLFITAGAPSSALAIDASGRVGLGTTTPNAAAQLEIISTTRGFLLPRMTTTQRDAISSPPQGLVIYNTTTGTVQAFTALLGGSWVSL